MDIFPVNDNEWHIPAHGDMRVPGVVFTSVDLTRDPQGEEALRQVVNVATLPGIVGASLAMPDLHWGYGFPIGGVAAFDLQEGVISPGGVGYDINCGVRLAASKLDRAAVAPRLEKLADALYAAIPCGVGVGGPWKLSAAEEKKALTRGSRWALDHGWATEQDIERTEDQGCLPEADPDIVSERALARGKNQLGTLGSGNHFLEVGVVERVYDARTAEIFGLQKDQVTLMIHSGSRGLGHQICDDYLAAMNREIPRQSFQLVDRQLACAPLDSAVGRRYQRAVAAAANYAWLNRQLLLHQARDVFARVFHLSPTEIGLRLVYDVCHNIAKTETHQIEGRDRAVCVHRKGATRAFPPEHPALPPVYRTAGQPVLIPGDMGTASYVLAGRPPSLEKSFGSSCHGAGRLLSRRAAKKTARGRNLFQEMSRRGIFLRCAKQSTAAEEMPEAYKSVDEVVSVVDRVGLSQKVARIKPLVVIKG